VKPRTLAAIALLVNALLQLADMATTGFALLWGGSEGNPGTLALMQHFGMGGWVLLKVLLALALVAFIGVAWEARGNVARSMAWTSGCFAILMMAVLVNNVIVLGTLAG
jgi:hypothetical protein